ncbi:MAG: SCO family protein [Pyrinomonadaceae bacterium]|nr:SCO family protein [Sphingobacteriaceae bacterium]
MFNKRLIGVTFIILVSIQGGLFRLQAKPVGSYGYLSDSLANIERDKLSYSLELFKGTNSKSDQNTIVRLVDIFKLYGKSVHEVIDAISIKLIENDPIYYGRGPKEVERIRGYMLASLSEIGTNEKVKSIVGTELAYGYHPYLVAAAARTAGTIKNNSELIPLLTKYLDDGYKDDFVDLDHYGNNWPLKAPTSVRLEVIKSLGKIGASDTEVALKGLSEITENNQKYFFSLDSSLYKQAKIAINLIKNTNQIADFPQSSLPASSINSHACCSTESASSMTNTIWINSDKRSLQMKDIKAVDQNGNDFKFSNALGKPFALTFFYTRCDNPNKCSATIEHFARLQQSLRKEGLGNKVDLFGITLEPSYDIPIQLSAYGKDRGMDFDDNSKFLTIGNMEHEGLISDLGVLVSYGKGLVNNHGSQLYIFDKKGRVAKIYDNRVWEDQSVIEDFADLLKEND